MPSLPPPSPISRRRTPRLTQRRLSWIANPTWKPCPCMQLPPSQEALKLSAKPPAPLCNASMASNVAAVLLCGHSLWRTSFVPAKGRPELAFHLTPLPHLPRWLSQLQFLSDCRVINLLWLCQKFLSRPREAILRLQWENFWFLPCLSSLWSSPHSPHLSFKIGAPTSNRRSSPPPGGHSEP
jgi:hypothetical protein